MREARESQTLSPPHLRVISSRCQPCPQARPAHSIPFQTEFESLEASKTLRSQKRLFSLSTFNTPPLSLPPNPAPTITHDNIKLGVDVHHTP